MEEYNRKPYLSSNYKKKNVVKHSSEWVPLTAGLPNGWYLDIGALLRGDGYKKGENIDRIKLPCFCSFEWNGKRRLGIILNGSFRIWGTGASYKHKISYELHLIDSQTHRTVGSAIEKHKSLEHLIERYKINIGKAHIDFCETYY